jgi:hypothetical protein
MAAAIRGVVGSTLNRSSATRKTIAMRSIATDFMAMRYCSAWTSRPTSIMLGGPDDPEMSAP